MVEYEPSSKTVDATELDERMRFEKHVDGKLRKLQSSLVEEYKRSDGDGTCSASLLKESAATLDKILDEMSSSKKGGEGSRSATPMGHKGLSKYKASKSSNNLEVGDSPPLLIFDRLEAGHIGESNINNLQGRLRHLLLWAKECVPNKLRIIEIRSQDAVGCILPDLYPDGAEAYADIAEIIEVHAGRSAIGHSIVSDRALVCCGIFEELMYPCHDLLRDGVKEVGFVPQLCGTSKRSGALLKPNVSSHLEEVLGAKVLASLKHAVEWLVPGGPELPHFSHGNHGAKIVVESQDDQKLNDEQESVIQLLFDDDVSEIKLKKLGKGFSSALKFFVTPLITKKGTVTTGALTFVKMGDEEEVDEELRITQHMMQILGVFCPQVLGYSELGNTAVLHLSLVNLGTSSPCGFADLYCELVSATKVVAGTKQGEKLLNRVLSCIEFVFSHLVTRLHESRAEKASVLSVADELGLCKDIGGKRGVEEGLHMSSAWVLEKLWKKKPGDGGLKSSIKIHMGLTLGEKEAKEKVLTFLPGHPCQVLNLCNMLTDNNLQKLKANSTFEIRQCFVHGDLHGDNIMLDEKDNRFLIDFGKTSLGHPLEDVLWLEAFILLSYTDYNSDAELSECLHLIPALAPANGLTPESCESTGMENALRGMPQPKDPRIVAMWAVLKALRHHLGSSMTEVAASALGNPRSSGNLTAERGRCCMIAGLLGLRNALFFLGARENKEAPRRRKLALALACAYTQSLLSETAPKT